MTGMEPTNLYAALEEIDDVYVPHIVNRVNDYDVKIARTRGEHVWHIHESTDEFFLVLEGHFEVAVRDSRGVETTVELRKGDTCVVPRGVEHKPTSHGGDILMFEPRGTASTGGVDEAGLPDHIRRSTGVEPTV